MKFIDESSKSVASLCHHFLSKKSVNFEKFFSQFINHPNVQDLQLKICHTFSNHHVLFTCFLHKSFYYECLAQSKFSSGKKNVQNIKISSKIDIYSKFNHNERFEFLGDTLINSYVSLVLFNKYPEYTEGEMSKHRSSIVNTENLAFWAKLVELDKLLILGKGEHRVREEISDKILAQVFEAFMAAIFIDCGQNYERFYTILNHLIFDLLKTQNEEIFSKTWPLDFDSISKLQEKMMVHHTLPVYKTLGSQVDDRPPFLVSLSLFGKEIKRVEENSKRKAYRILARYALENHLYEKENSFYKQKQKNEDKLQLSNFVKKVFKINNHQ